MVSVEAFSELLDVLYSAPLQDEQWVRFLSLLCEHTQTGRGVFISADSRLGPSVRASGGRTPFDASTIEAYNHDYAESDPFRAGVFRNPRTGIVQGDDLLPNEGLLQTDMYRNILAPEGVRYATLLILQINLRRLEVITLWRSPEQGPMTEDGNHLLNLIFPHIQKALELRQALGVTQQRLAGAEAIADASSTATFLLTGSGRVIHRNAAADALLQTSSVLSLSNSILTTTQPDARESLRKLLRQAAAPTFALHEASPAHALSLPRSAQLQPLQLLATPLPSSHRTRTGADILLLVTDPDRPLTFPNGTLHALYNLTPAEAEVASGLLTGYTLEEIANLRRVSAGTVRHQLKSILGKTNTTRQSDLVRLLMTLPQTLAG